MAGSKKRKEQRRSGSVAAFPASGRLNRAAFLLLAAAVLLLLMPEQPSGRDRGAAQRAESPDGIGGAGSQELSVGPGRLKFYFSGEGEWLGLFPEWTSGRSLIAGGGFLLFAEDDVGGLVQVAGPKDRAAPGKMVTFRGERYFEGCPGGQREPSPNPDDDGDGLTDEDRLDGVDNDGDGRIDEDYAAIGDEMAVVEYVSDTSQTSYQLCFHQECYAWSLPHLDAMVAVSLIVTNQGDRPVRGIRLGAFYQVEGPVQYSEQTIASPSRLDSRPATALVCSGDNSGGVGLLFLSEPGEGVAGRSYGVVRRSENFEEVFISQRSAEELFSGAEDEGNLLQQAKIGPGEQVIVYGVSTGLGALEPGEELRIDIALLAAKTAEHMENAIIEAFKTYKGDEINHYLPPPVSLRRRILWGSYKKLESPERGILITIEGARSEGITPGRFSFVSGLKVENIEMAGLSGENLVFTYRGNIPERMVDATGRLVLKGRVGSGDIFEVLLRPKSPLPAEIAGEAEYSRRRAAEYWMVPGKLSRELLASSPNPFRETTTIFYEVPATVDDEKGITIPTQGALEVGIKVYDVTGRLVGVLVDDVLSPGRYSAQWNAVDENHIPVASGVYYVKLQIGKRHVTKRLILLK